MKYKIGDRVFKFDNFTIIEYKGKIIKTINHKIGKIKAIDNNQYLVSWFDLATDFPYESLHKENEENLYLTIDELVKDIREKYKNKD